MLTGFAVLVMGFALTLTLSRSGIGCFLLAMVLSAFHVLRRQVSTTKGRLLSTYLALVFVAAVPGRLLAARFTRELRRRLREGRDDRTGYWIRLGALTGIVAIAFQEIVEFSLQMPGNAALFTVLCAIAVRRAAAVSNPSVRKTSRIDTRRWYNMTRPWHIMSRHSLRRLL